MIDTREPHERRSWGGIPRRARAAVLLAAVLVAALLLAAAAMANGRGTATRPLRQARANSCVTCHTSRAALARASGRNAHVARFLVARGFVTSRHGRLGCVSCHGGRDGASGQKAAHRGMTANPSLAGAGSASCGACHSSVVTTFGTSLHRSAAGIWNKLRDRLSKADHGQAIARRTFRGKGGCGGCHSSCGDCHVSWPRASGAGLRAGHKFVTRTTVKQDDRGCVGCHDVIGPDYVSSDLHHKAGMGCSRCHTDRREYHGDGTARTDIHVAGAVVTRCVDCHQTLSASIHSPAHLAGATCEACHAAPYVNCYGGCHNGVEGGDRTRVRLGIGRDGRLDTFRHTPVSSDMFGGGVNFVPFIQLGGKATWVETAVHTTALPGRTQALCDRCHGPGTALLRPSELVFPDIEQSLLPTPLPPVS